jgi:hypothetical protein
MPPNLNRTVAESLRSCVDMNGYHMQDEYCLSASHDEKDWLTTCLKTYTIFKALEQEREE